MKPAAIALLLVMWAIVFVGALAAIYTESQKVQPGEAVPETRQW